LQDQQSLQLLQQQQQHPHLQIQPQPMPQPQPNHNYEYISINNGTSNNNGASMNCTSPHQLIMLSPPHSYTATQSPINSLLSPNTPMLLSPPLHQPQQPLQQTQTLLNKPPPTYEDVIKHQRTSSVTYTSYQTQQAQSQQTNWTQNHIQQQQQQQQTYHSIPTPNVSFVSFFPFLFVFSKKSPKELRFKMTIIH